MIGAEDSAQRRHPAEGVRRLEHTITLHAAIELRPHPEGIGEAARSVAREGTEIIDVSPDFGPVSIESYYDEYVAACGVLDEVRKVRTGRYFFNPAPL